MKIKQTMKASIWIMALAIVVIVSCKKDVDTRSSYYYIKMTVNGTESLFTDNAYAGEYSGDFTAGFSMYASDDSSHAALSLTVIHPFGNILTKGEYSANSYPYLTSSGYKKADTLSYYGGRPGVPTVDIIISHLTENIVSGSFTGYYYNSTNLQDSIHVVNGSFYLPVSH